MTNLISAKLAGNLRFAAFGLLSSILMACIQALTDSPTAENVEVFYERVKTSQPWSDNPDNWPAQFMLDSELNWMEEYR